MMLNLFNKYVGATYLLAPLFSYATGISPYQTGILLTKVMVPCGILAGICTAIALYTPKDDSNLNRVIGLGTTGVIIYSCFLGWLGLGTFSLIKAINTPFVQAFF
jgi:FtsH-binding integral membrane protein